MDGLNEWINRFKYVLIILLIILVVIIGIALYKLDEKNKKKNVVDDISSLEIKDEEEIEIKEEIPINVFVDIKGEVINPGVYEVSKDAKVINVIEKAGGPTDYADTSLINLSKNVTSEMVIIIYNKDEVLEKKKENVSIIVEECVCPEIVNDACLEDIQESGSGLVSLNSATIEELTTIPSIGESKAKDIINYRNSIGSFTNIEELKNVSGIGDSTFDKIKNYITL